MSDMLPRHSLLVHKTDVAELTDWKRLDLDNAQHIVSVIHRSVEGFFCLFVSCVVHNYDMKKISISLKTIGNIESMEHLQ